MAALRPGAPLRDGYEAAGAVPSAIVALRGGTASPALPRDSGVIAETGMALGVRTATAAPGGGAVELAATVAVTGSGAEPLTRTPLRLVELY